MPAAPLPAGKSLFALDDSSLELGAECHSYHESPLLFRPGFVSDSERAAAGDGGERSKLVPRLGLEPISSVFSVLLIFAFRCSILAETIHSIAMPASIIAAFVCKGVRENVWEFLGLKSCLGNLW